jgi:hypothetical protein
MPLNEKASSLPSDSSAADGDANRKVAMNRVASSDFMLFSFVRCGAKLTQLGRGANMTFTSPDDPYSDRKKYHRADKSDGRGNVSALCFKRPRPIDLSRALWTTDDRAVTCKKCIALIRVAR